ncbi:MAG: sodium ion-translocating decarboxylase subunit beta, partial [Muribaculaceae bacterium]|nr:sodium ion-translocating decarboxylase subunit beta [Muribaculaceae bacterium]
LGVGSVRGVEETAMGPNVAGVIGSAVAAGVLLGFLA